MALTRTHNVRVDFSSASALLARNFNQLWCAALNSRERERCSLFAMHHADIGAEPFWLDKLIVERERVGADILSVVIPIKDERGLTSTGYQCKKTHNVWRFTMREIMEFPVTFDAAAVGKGEYFLAVNTGLMVCDFSKPWVEEFHFEVRDRIRRDEAGKFKVATMPEDWSLSAWAQMRGLKVMATRCVGITHHGRASFPNDQAWGEWETEKGSD